MGLERPECGKEGYVLNCRDDSGRQRCPCELCDRRFGDNPGFEYRHTLLFITLAPVLNGAGMPPYGLCLGA